jgi:hypothetical protein
MTKAKWNMHPKQKAFMETKTPPVLYQGGLPARTGRPVADFLTFSRDSQGRLVTQLSEDFHWWEFDEKVPE